MKVPSLNHWSWPRSPANESDRLIGSCDWSAFELRSFDGRSKSESPVKAHLSGVADDRHPRFSPYATPPERSRLPPRRHRLVVLCRGCSESIEQDFVRGRSVAVHEREPWSNSQGATIRDCCACVCTCLSSESADLSGKACEVFKVEVQNFSSLSINLIDLGLNITCLSFFRTSPWSTMS